MPLFYIAQNVGINATGSLPDATSMLDVNSSNSGVLVPRVALTSINMPINNPTKSLLVWNTSTVGLYPNEGFHYFDGVDWVRIDDGKISANAVSLNSAAPIIPTNSTTAALGLPSFSGYCAVCVPIYGYASPTGFGSLNTSGHVIDGTVQSITVTAIGANTSGVVIMGNVVVKAINTGNVASSARYAIILQRSTNAAFTTPTNIYKIEDMAGPRASGTNPVSGTATSTLIYPDLALNAGVYYYRLVFMGMLAASNGQSAAIIDRSIVLLQVKN